MLWDRVWSITKSKSSPRWRDHFSRFYFCYSKTSGLWLGGNHVSFHFIRAESFAFFADVAAVSFYTFCSAALAAFRYCSLGLFSALKKPPGFLVNASHACFLRKLFKFLFVSGSFSQTVALGEGMLLVLFLSAMSLHRFELLYCMGWIFLVCFQLFLGPRWNVSLFCPPFP